MFRVLLVIINLELALGLPEVYGIPPDSADVPTQEFHVKPVQQLEGRKPFSVSPQDQDLQEAELPHSHREQTQDRDTSPPVPTDQYGLPSGGHSLKNSYSHWKEQSALQNSGESIKYDLARGSYDQLRSSQELSNDELIASYKPPVVSNTRRVVYMNDQDSGLDYADYAPHHRAKYVAGTTKSDLPSYPSQITQNEEYDIPMYHSLTEFPEYNDDSYQSSRAQKTDISNDYNDQVAPTYDQEVTAGSTAESQVPSYPNSRCSQNVQCSETEAAFQNPSYENPKYDVPAVVSQDARLAKPAHQTSRSRYQKAQVAVPEFSSPVRHNANYDGSPYRSSDAQDARHENVNYDASVSRMSPTYGVPAVYSSDYRDSKHDLPPYKSSSVYNQVDRTQKSRQRYATPDCDYKTPGYQTGGYARYVPLPAHRDSAIRGQNYETDSYRRPLAGLETPVRYIAIFQKHRAPGRADISTTSYFTQALHDQRQTQVLPVLPNYHRDSPSGSISSTFISKDVGAYHRQPPHPQQPYRNDAQIEASNGDVSNAYSHSSYGLPNF